MDERTKAEELYNTFLTVLQNNTANFQITNLVTKELAKACCDKLINETIGTEKAKFYKVVRYEIDVL